MPEIYVTPVAGFVVRDPVTGQHLPPHGAYKPRTQHWLRTARDGAVTISTGPARAVAPAKTKREG